MNVNKIRTMAHSATRAVNLPFKQSLGYVVPVSNPAPYALLQKWVLDKCCTKDGFLKIDDLGTFGMN